MNQTVTVSLHHAYFRQALVDGDYTLATKEELARLREIQAECDRLDKVLAAFSRSELEQEAREYRRTLIGDPSKVTVELIQNLEAKTQDFIDRLRHQRSIAKRVRWRYSETVVVAACKPVLVRAIAAMSEVTREMTERMKERYELFGVPYTESALESAMQCTIAGFEHKLDSMSNYSSPRNVLGDLVIL
jgi:hypothetical protein